MQAFVTTPLDKTYVTASGIKEKGYQAYVAISESQDASLTASRQSWVLSGPMPKAGTSHVIGYVTNAASPARCLSPLL